MTTPQKTNALQAYQIIVYERALHPELFPLRARRVVKHGQWELEAWVMQGQHLLRFEYGPVCASELLTDQEAGLPTSGAVDAFLCAGERDYERCFTGTSKASGPGATDASGGLVGGDLGPDGLVHVASLASGPSAGGSNGKANGRNHTKGGSRPGVVYMLTVQTETLSENLYAATCDEMAAHIRENDSLCYKWQDEAGRGMSILDIQRYAHEVHAQSYHLIPAGGIVIRTQTIFEHA